MSHGELFKIEKQLSPSETYGHCLEYPYSSYLVLLIAFQFLCLSNTSSCSFFLPLWLSLPLYSLPLLFVGASFGRKVGNVEGRIKPCRTVPMLEHYCFKALLNLAPPLRPSLSVRS